MATEATKQHHPVVLAHEAQRAARVQAEQNAEDTERRIENEAQLRANSILLEAREEAVKIRQGVEQDIREKMANALSGGSPTAIPLRHRR